MKSKMIYLLVLFYACYIAVMYDGTSPRFFFFLLLLLPLLGFALSSYLIRGVHVQIKANPSLVSKGEEAALQMEIQNNGILPIPFLSFRLSIGSSDGISNVSQKVKIFGMVDAKAEESFHYQIQTVRCGKIQIRMKDIMVFDYLCLTKRRLRLKQELEVTVLPPIYPIHVKITGKTASFLMDGEEFSKVKSGEDSSELFDIRPYQPGDRQQRIHWKMTARTGKLMVKEFSQPIGNKVVLFLDLKAEGMKQKKRFISDAFYEVVISLSYAMISEQIGHYVVWFHESEGKIHRENIQSEADVFQMVNRLYETNSCLGDNSIMRQYDEIYGRQSYSTAVCFDRNLYLQVGEQEKVTIPENKIKETLTELVLEI